jgi:amidophosphoribosyltransferase
MDELQHECGIAAVYHLNSDDLSPLIPRLRGPDRTVIDPATEEPSVVRNRALRLVPGMLLDMQNRGQLAAGITSFNARRLQLIQTHKDVGGVAEVFRMNHEDRYKQLMAEHAGQAAIGHVRYATCGKDDPTYAQPFERHHIAQVKMVQLRIQRATGKLPRTPRRNPENHRFSSHP